MKKVFIWLLIIVLVIVVSVLYHNYNGKRVDTDIDDKIEDENNVVVNNDIDIINSGELVENSGEEDEPEITSNNEKDDDADLRKT